MKKEYHLLTKSTTKYVVITYYYFRKSDKLKAKLLISLSPCVGFYINPQTCQTIQMLGFCVNQAECEYFHGSSQFSVVQLSPPHRCAVIIVPKFVSRLVDFVEMKLKCRVSLSLLLSYFKHQNSFKETQLESYMADYDLTFHGYLSMTKITNLDEFGRVDKKNRIHSSSKDYPVDRTYGVASQLRTKSLHQQHTGNFTHAQIAIISDGIASKENIVFDTVILRASMYHILDSWATVSVNLLSCDKKCIIFEKFVSQCFNFFATFLSNDNETISLPKVDLEDNG